MKYKYFDKHKRLLFQSDSPVEVNKDLFPVWADIEPIVEDKHKTKTSTKSWNKEEENK